MPKFELDNGGDKLHEVPQQQLDVIEELVKETKRLVGEDSLGMLSHVVFTKLMELHNRHRRERLLKELEALRPPPSPQQPDPGIYGRGNTAQWQGDKIGQVPAPPSPEAMALLKEMHAGEL